MAAALVLVTLAFGTMISAVPSPAPAAIWRDDFDEACLRPRWSWMAEDPDTWSLTAHPGFLRITTTQDNNNYLVQAAPIGDFEIEARVVFTPSEDFQQAGLGLYLDDGNQLSRMRAYCDRSHCIGNGIYHDVVDGGSSSSYSATTPVQGKAFLKVVRRGDVFTGYVSEDGSAWTMVGAPTVSFTPTQLGLRAGNNLQAASQIPADFDYFLLHDPSYQVLTVYGCQNPDRFGPVFDEFSTREGIDVRYDDGCNRNQLKGCAASEDCPDVALVP